MAGQGRGDNQSPFVGLPGSWQGRAGLWDEGPGPGRSGFGFGAEDDGSTRLVRPYTVTGGRTQPRYQLAIEALVTATELDTVADLVIRDDIGTVLSPFIAH